VGLEPDTHKVDSIFLPINLSIPTLEAVNALAPVNENDLFTLNGVTTTSDVINGL
jgi:hypothetical protein